MSDSDGTKVSKSSNTVAIQEDANVSHKKGDARSLLYCGLISGVLQAGIFNFWDRALFLSLKEDRVFLHRANFHKPFAGMVQSLIQRTLSGGLFFPLEDIFRQQIVYLTDSEPHGKELTHTQSFLSGLLAGGTIGIVLNPASAIKYHMWGATEREYARSFLTTAKHIYKKGGFPVFLVGSGSTLGRDVIFGGIYGVLRHELMLQYRESSVCVDGVVNPTHKYIINVFSGCCATIASSPLNYIRNVHYASSPSRKVTRPSGRKILYRLYTRAMKYPTTFEALRYVQRQFRLGWGTARVGFGMAFSEYVYNFCSKQIKNR